MVLSVKTALAISMGFIVSFSWLINQVSIAPLEIDTPPAIRSEPEAISLLPLERRFLRPSAAALPSSPRIPEPLPSSSELALSETTENRLPPIQPPAVTPRSAGSLLLTAILPQPRSESTTGPTPASPPPSNPAVPPVVDSAQAPLVDAQPKPVGPASMVGRQYTVQSGETLTGIARRVFNSRDARWVKVLLEANPQLKRRDGRVRAGEALVIPPVTELAAAKSPPAARSTADRKPVNTASNDARPRVAAKEAPAERPRTASSEPDRATKKSAGKGKSKSQAVRTKGGKRERPVSSTLTSRRSAPGRTL